MDLLEGIDELDWSEWEDAYGPATDFPETARELLQHRSAREQIDLEGMTPMELARYRALTRLLGPPSGLAAQMMLEEAMTQRVSATQHAIPWLIKLLAPESTANRPWLLGFLNRLAGEPTVRQHARSNRGSENFAAKMREVIDLVEAVERAVVDGSGQLRTKSSRENHHGTRPRG